MSSMPLNHIFSRVSCISVLSVYCLVCVLALSACAPARSLYKDKGYERHAGMVKDIQDFPQDLMVYARIDGEDTALLSPQEQSAQDARYNRIYFGPWDMNKATTKPKQFRAPFATVKGYVNTSLWTQTRWDTLRHNADMNRYPSLAHPAITVRHTNLRELPTHEGRYSKPTPSPKANPFDLFQYSSLPVGTPLFVTHKSRDGQWYYAENPIAAGWVHVQDVATVDTGFINHYRNGRYAAVIRDQVQLMDEQKQFISNAHIGAILPVVAIRGDDLEVYVPRRDSNGKGTLERTFLRDGDAVIKPLPMLPKLMAVIGNGMLGQPYAWGGMYENRDCSAATRDIFVPFGIWLPRNSSAQAKAGRYTTLEGMDAHSKEQTILTSAVPFMSLLWMRGHVGLYVGNYKGRAAIFHNIWGVRINDGETGENRHIIARCVITSLEPGKELNTLDPTATMLHRLRGISTLPGTI